MNKRETKLAVQFFTLARRINRLDKNGPLRGDPGYEDLNRKIAQIRKRMSDILDQLLVRT